MDLIQTKNPNLFKETFQETLYQQKKTATLEVLKVSGTYPSIVNDNDNFYIECKILSELPECKGYEVDSEGKPLKDKEGNKKIINVNATGEIISLPYHLKPVPNRQDLYKVSTSTNLFQILNYAFKVKGIVPKSNTQGFDNISIEEIQEGLEGVTLKVRAELWTKTKYKPYLRLVAIEREPEDS